MTELWAFVMVDEDGDDVIIATNVPGTDQIAPLIAPFRELAMLMMPAAIAAANGMKRPVRLLHFTEVHEEMIGLPTEGESPHLAMSDSPIEPLHPERLN